MFSTKPEYMQNINTVLHCKPHNNKAYDTQRHLKLKMNNKRTVGFVKEVHQLWGILKVALN